MDTDVRRFNPITYVVDAARSLMLGRDVMTAVDVTRFGGVLNSVVPGVAVLAVIGLVFGAVAVYLLS